MRKMFSRKVSPVLVFMMIFSMCISFLGYRDIYAKSLDNSGNEYISTNRIATGKVGSTMTVSMTFTNNSGRDLSNVSIGLSSTNDVSSVSGDDSSDGYIFPFEQTTDLFNTKNIGDIKSGAKKTVSFSFRVRRDLTAGYYGAWFYATADGGFATGDEAVNIWVTQSTTSDSTSDDAKAVSFVLGEGQTTPYGVYPNVMDFSLNLRNSGTLTAHDVTASIVMDKDSTIYPFDINQVNYDIHFDTVSYGETVVLPYSMAIRSDAYSGYYPIKMNITYRESVDGELKTAETSFFVNIVNKEKESTQTDFNANDRVKARLIIDSYRTEPETVYAGDTFELILTMKNASSNVSASNILFSFESEKDKDTESSIFSAEGGANSLVVNSLAAGQTTELRMKFTAKAGVSQKAYTMTLKEQYDSPEFKNAQESVTMDIMVRQVPRLNTGNIEVLPESIGVGEESNVMFSINNLGRVTLYNVMVTFEADSIETNQAYVGNINSGSTGNVDIMLKGLAGTMDDGKINVTISYEDENGDESTMQKDLTLYVNEASMDEYDYTGEEMTDFVEEPARAWYANPAIWIAVVVAVVVIVVIVVIVKKRKKKDFIGDEDEDY